MDARALRQALAAFLGGDQYRKFVHGGVRRGRLRYWQEDSWRRFAQEHPEFNVSLEDLAASLRICHVHGDELQPDVVPVIHACVDYTREYEQAWARLFPHAALEVSTEGRPFDAKEIEVWYCPSCRVAEANWRNRGG